MLKKTMTYTDYNGVSRTEDFYFNLSKAELAEMELTQDGGLENYLNRIVNSRDTAAIVAVFKELLLKAYGVKSDDGKRFIKSKEISVAFSQTEAYSDLFINLATDSDAATAFVDGIVPKVDSNTNAALSPDDPKNVIAMHQN